MNESGSGFINLFCPKGWHIHMFVFVYDIKKDEVPLNTVSFLYSRVSRTIFLKKKRRVLILVGAVSIRTESEHLRRELRDCHSPPASIIAKGPEKLNSLPTIQQLESGTLSTILTAPPLSFSTFPLLLAQVGILISL